MKNALIAIYILFIAFLVGSAIFASRTFDGDFDDAYAQGMRYPETVAQIKNLGWNFSIIKHQITKGVPGKIELMIVDDNGSPVQGAEIIMELSMVTRLDSVPQQKATEKIEGQYVANVVLPSHGQWRVDCRINYEGEEILHKFRVYVEEGEKQ